MRFNEYMIFWRDTTLTRLIRYVYLPVTPPLIWNADLAILKWQYRQYMPSFRRRQRHTAHALY